MTHVVDLLPTCVQLAGATYPGQYKGNTTEPLQGLSLTRTFENQPLSRDTLYFEMNGNRAIRTEKWKAVAKEGLPKDWRYRVVLPIEYWELYDMDNDRTETKNVAESHPELLRQLISRWEQWIQTP
jgi:arylsulfatase